MKGIHNYGYSRYVLKSGFVINSSIRKSEIDKFVSNVNGFIPVPIVKQVLSEPISTIIKTMF